MKVSKILFELQGVNTGPLDSLGAWGSIEVLRVSLGYSKNSFRNTKDFRVSFGVPRRYEKSLKIIERSSGVL